MLIQFFFSPSPGMFVLLCLPVPTSSGAFTGQALLAIAHGCYGSWCVSALIAMVLNFILFGTLVQIVYPSRMENPARFQLGT